MTIVWVPEERRHEGVESQSVRFAGFHLIVTRSFSPILRREFGWSIAGYAPDGARFKGDADTEILAKSRAITWMAEQLERYQVIARRGWSAAEARS